MVDCKEYADTLKGLGWVRDVETYQIGERCVLDFVSEKAERLIDCNDLCYQWSSLYEPEEGEESEEEQEEGCLEVCEDTKKAYVKGSVEVNSNTGVVMSSTIPIDCTKIFGDVSETYDMDYEEAQEYMDKTFEKVSGKFERGGCGPLPETTDWIHSHEFVRGHTGGAFEPEEDLPLICYLHPNGCTLNNLVKVLREVV